MDDINIKTKVEGILFAMGDSVSCDRMADAIGCRREDVIEAAEELSREFLRNGRGVRIIKINDSYQMCTAPEIYDTLINLVRQPRKLQLTEVLMETLSIIAYRQPVTKAEIEKIRGVSSDHAVSKLVEYDLVCELGRLDAPGRPMLFGTTDSFLKAFGLTSLDDLPVLDPVKVEEFKQEAEEEADVSLSDGMSDE
jgi:segregation and condensation protein B